MGFFDVGTLEILLILVIAFLVFGPGKLPEIARTMGGWLRQFRTTTEQFKKDLSLGLTEEVKTDTPGNAKVVSNPAADETVVGAQGSTAEDDIEGMEVEAAVGAQDVSIEPVAHIDTEHDEDL